MGRHIIFLLATMLISVSSYTQTRLDTLFDNARMQNNRKEFASAANLFIQTQEEALKTGDTARYILSVTAEGECYYMLELATEVKAVIKKAKSAYNNYSHKLDKNSNFLLLESINKLEGSYYYCMTNSDTTAYLKAEKAYTKCLNILDSIKDESSFDDKELQINVHRELLSLYYKQKLYGRALKEADIVYLHRRNIGFDPEDVSVEGIRDYDNFVDAYVSRAMVLARLNRFDEANKLLEEMPETCHKEASVLRIKGKILMLQYAIDGTDNRKSAKEYYNKYITLFKQEFTNQFTTLTDSQREEYWLAIHDFLFDCCCLEDYAPELLYNLVLFSKGYLTTCSASKKTSDITWNDIRKNLKPDECAIEFVQYKNHKEEKQIAALIIRNNYQHPLFIRIGSVNEITSTHINNGESIETAITNDIGATKDILYSDSTFFKKIWSDEIIKLTSNCKNIYFSPDGFLHQLAIEYMYPDSSVNCYRLSSTRQLSIPKQQHLGNILLCGGIDYYADVKPEKNNNDIFGYNKFRENPIYINKLDGTETEVDSIYILGKENTKEQQILLKDKDATDEKFCHLAQEGYSIIHLATHGYFSGENKFNDLKPLFKDHTMSESGLMMAGVGKNIISKDFNPQYSDGILTAKELSRLHLPNTDLIVLSACRTGLGTITTDGVSGMQRALKTAGVKAMIVSLWSVDDKATAEFMKIFHKELNKNRLTKRNIYKAFNATRKFILSEGKIAINSFKSQTLTRKKTSRAIDSPQYTNAFILIDGI